MEPNAEWVLAEKWLGHEAYHSPPPTSPICLHGTQKDNFTFVLCCYLELYYSGIHNSKRNCYTCLQGSERARGKTSLTAHVLSIILLLLIMNTNTVKVFRISDQCI